MNEIQRIYSLLTRFGSGASLYHWHEIQHATFSPLNVMAHASKAMHSHPLSPLSYMPMGKQIAAASEVLARVTSRYKKPVFGIHSTKIGGKTFKVKDTVIARKPFCRLLHFKKTPAKKQPQLLIVAPMSGHHSTLLRGTVEALLPHADVFITDWRDAREVPASEGNFDLDDYIDYVIDFTRLLAKKGSVHLLAVCQPAVPVYATAALMNAAKDKATPASITLIGGPIDTREAPTKVNIFAQKHSLEWFQSHLVTVVPFNYPGFMRRVYPGFLQLASFISMNLERHVDAHVKFFNHLVEGDGDGATQHKKFYDEYLSVIDITAEFYLQTLDTVFHKHALPKGEMMHRDDLVDPKALTKTALLCLEGELDDISGVGQTKAAMKISSNLPAKMKKYHMEPGVGHYGIFNGRKFRENVVPIIADWMKKWD